MDRVNVRLCGCVCVEKMGSLLMAPSRPWWYLFWLWAPFLECTTNCEQVPIIGRKANTLAIHTDQISLTFAFLLLFFFGHIFKHNSVGKFSNQHYLLLLTCLIFIFFANTILSLGICVEFFKIIFFKFKHLPPKN